MKLISSYRMVYRLSRKVASLEHRIKRLHVVIDGYRKDQRTTLHDWCGEVIEKNRIIEEQRLLITELWKRCKIENADESRSLVSWIRENIGNANKV